MARFVTRKTTSDQTSHDAETSRGAPTAPHHFLKLQRLAGNRAVARDHRLVLQRLKETRENKAQITPLKARYLAAHVGDFAGWQTLLAGATTVNDLSAKVDAVAPAPIAAAPVPVAAPVRTPEVLAPNVTSFDDNGLVVGPFNGRVGSKTDIKGVKGSIFYDAAETWAITWDRDQHAGESWKLLTRGSKGWRRVDTIFVDGRRMFRG
jgi:hypothetical protein